MTTIQNRLKKNILFEAIKIYIKQNKNWDKFTSFLKKLQLMERIGNDSKFGKVFQGYFNYFPLKEDNQILSIKLIPIHPIDLEFMLIEDYMKHEHIFKSKSIWKEIYVLRLCFKLLKLKKSINLPIHYFCLYSNNHDFLKSYTNENPNLFVFNELANDDLKNWSKQERSFEEWKSCFLQIFFGLYVLQYYSGILHNDLHWANILVFNIEKGGQWCYTINEQQYYIQNLGYLFVLWDFGMSSYIPEVIECNSHSKSCQDFLKILNTPKWIHKYYPEIKVPQKIISFCNDVRSLTFKNMNEILFNIISPISKMNNDNYIIEEYLI